MRRTLTVLALGAFFVPAAILAGCGGVPGNAVAEVDGTAIEKEDFEHWLNVGAKASGQPDAKVPVPPDFKACIASAKKSAAKPAEGQPKQTDADYKAQCKQQYDQLREQMMGLLISFEWIEREAKDQGIKVSDAEVKKSFEEQKKQSFPKDADYQKFLKDSGQTEEDVLMRVRLDTLSNKIRDKVTKGKDKVSDQQIEDYYNKNKAQFAQPERRDLSIVLTKTEAKAERGQGGARERRVLQVGRQGVLDRRRLQGAGRQAAGRRQGPAGEGVRRGDLQGREGQDHRPGQDAVRLLRLQGRQGHQGVAADARAGQDDDPAGAGLAEPAEGARRVRQGLPQEVEGEDGVPRRVRHAGLQERAEADADADARARSSRTARSRGDADARGPVAGRRG